MAPATAHDAYIMFQGVGDFLETLANGACIASTGNTLAAILILKHGPKINRLMKDQGKPYFLIKLLHQVDRECHFLFKEFYNDIKLTGPNLYQVYSSKIATRNMEITRILDGLKRNDISRHKLPSGLLALLQPRLKRNSGGLDRPIKKARELKLMILTTVPGLFAVVEHKNRKETFGVPLLA